MLFEKNLRQIKLIGPPVPFFGTPLHKGRPYTSGKTGVIHRYTHLCRAEISLDCKGVTFFLNGLACVAVVNFDT